MISEKRYDNIIKIVIVGNSGVGKTSVVRRFTKNSFSESTKSTLGVDLETRCINLTSLTNSSLLKEQCAIFGDKIVQLQFWDTSGQEKFMSLTPNYYRGSHGIIYMYDITNHKSFEDLEKWIKHVDSHQTPHPLHVDIIIGNKNDCELRCVTTEEVKTFANAKGIECVEVSAKTADCIDDAFFTLAEKILERIPLESYSDSSTTNKDKNKSMILDSVDNVIDKDTKDNTDACC